MVSGLRVGRAPRLRRAARRLVVFLVVPTLLASLSTSPTTAGASAECRVRNTDTGEIVGRLQQAVRTAKPGDKLIVTGTCRGGTFINKSLAIEGGLTTDTGRAILDGNGKVRVLVIKKGVTLSIRDLVVSRGQAGRVPRGGGITNKGRLTLRDVIVRLNTATLGGGIYNEGVVRIEGRSVVRSNESGAGGGVYNLGRAVLAGTSRVRFNGPRDGVYNEGLLVMKDRAAIIDNHGFRVGGGVENRGTFVMHDAAHISLNSNLGGVRNHGSFTMNDTSSIRQNSAGGSFYPGMCGTGAGGGVHNYGILALNDSASIGGNTAQMCPPGVGQGTQDFPGRGGGVFNEGTVSMIGASRITGNEAESGSDGEVGLGGGLYNASGGTLVGVNCAPHTYANVYGNTPDDCYFE